MKRTTAAVVTVFLAATPLASQDTSSQGISDDTDWTQLIRTRDITGGAVYTTNKTYDEGTWGGAPPYVWGWSGYTFGTDWNEIGEIEDVVLNKAGQMEGVVVEVGGFLGIGDKHVLLRLGDVDLVPTDGNYVLITRYSEEQLEKLPSVDEGWWE